MSVPKKAQLPRVAIGPDVTTEQALTERGVVVSTMAVITALYLSSSAFKAVIDDFISSAAALSTSQTKVTNLEAELTQARGDRDQAHIVALAAHGAAVKQVERVSTTPADVKSYGFLHLEIVKLGTVAPVAILAAMNPKTKLLDIHVRYPPGVRGQRCIIEISTDPIGPTTYHRLDGDGVKRSLSGYAPGTYWIRAATNVAEGRSDWFGPVSVIVS